MATTTLRIDPELSRKISLIALLQGKSKEQLVSETLRQALADELAHLEEIKFR